jgi:S-layer homology domain
MSDITSVSQLTDVDPTQCYYKDLQSLIERYGISVEYSDNTFRGEQTMTRAEAVQLVNQALDRVLELIAASEDS